MNAAVWSKNGKWLMGVTLVTMSTLAHAQSFHEWHGSGLRSEAYTISRSAAAGRWYGEHGAASQRARGLRAPRGSAAGRTGGRASARAYYGGASGAGGYGMYGRDGYAAGGGTYAGGYSAGSGSGYGGNYGGNYSGYGGSGPALRAAGYGGNGAPPANYRLGVNNVEPHDPSQRAGSIREDVTRYNEEHNAPRPPARGGGSSYRPVPPAGSYRN